jgi:hypothetical protein
MDEYVTCKRIELTYLEPEWKPIYVRYSDKESWFVHDDGTIRSTRVPFSPMSHMMKIDSSMASSRCLEWL